MEPTEDMNLYTTDPYGHYAREGELYLHLTEPGALLAAAPVPAAEQLWPLTDDDMRQAERFGHGLRRRQFLGWRALVRSLLGTEADIRYDEAGAPRFAGHAWRLGVSHDSGMIAVTVAAGRCGVDVERIDRNFGRVRGRYIDPCEEALAASADPLFAAALWCGKEALYKYAGRRGLDFLRDLRIMDARFECACRVPETAFVPCGRLAGSVCGGQPVAIRLYRSERHLLAWIAGTSRETDRNNL